MRLLDLESETELLYGIHLEVFKQRTFVILGYEVYRRKGDVKIKQSIHTRAVVLPTFEADN